CCADSSACLFCCLLSLRRPRMSTLFPYTTLFRSGVLAGCKELLENRIDTKLTPDQVFVNYDRMLKMGYGVYTYIPAGFNRVGGALFAAASDEAEHTDFGSSVQSFNLGAWDAYSNPDDIFVDTYRGIRAANLFLENTLT